MPGVNNVKCQIVKCDHGWWECESNIMKQLCLSVWSAMTATQMKHRASVRNVQIGLTPAQEVLS